MVAVDRLLKRALSKTVRQRSLFSVMMGKHFLITACEKAREVKFLGISDAKGREINDLLFNKRESGWLSGYQQCLPPLRPGFNSRPRDRMWLEFQSISTWPRGFFSGYSGFPPSAKSTHSLFHQAVLLCSEVIHGSCSGAERLAGSTAPSVRSRWAAPLAIQSPTARKGDQQVTYYYYYYYYYYWSHFAEGKETKREGNNRG